MESLPQEVVNNIVAFLPDKSGGATFSFASFATVSRAWQNAVESRTFRRLRVKHSDLMMLDAATRSQSRSRFLWLRELSFQVALPTYSDEACAKYETDQDRATNDAVASEQIVGLLQVLSTWPSGCNITLDVSFDSPMDTIHRGEEKLEGDRLAVATGHRGDLFGDRYRYSYISLSDDILHFHVPSVRRLVPSGGTTRSLHPGCLVALTGLFPNLNAIHWSYQEPDFFVGHRRRNLEQFADAITSYDVPSTTRRLHLRVEAPEYPHKEKVPDLVGPQDEKSLCSALHAMIARSRIEKVVYEGPIDPTFFWPSVTSDERRAPSAVWRSVTDIWVEFGPASFSGQWYFGGLQEDSFYRFDSDVPLPYSEAGPVPPGYATENETEDAKALSKAMMPLEEDGFYVDGQDFRSRPRDGPMNSLLAAFATCLSNAPVLKRARMESRLPQDHGDWFICYGAPGVKCGYEEYMEDPNRDISTARIFIHTEDWRPDAGTMQKLQDVGENRFDEKTLVTFMPFIY